jgi:hypothetical protein
MLRTLIGAVALLALFAAQARAQVTDSLPGYSPYDSNVYSFGLGPDYEQVRSPEQIERDLEIERRYRETVNARIPNRKPSNDPWKNIRPAPAAAVPYDRHRPM